VVPDAANKVLDQLGIPAAERNIANLTDADWYMARVATGERLAQPVGAFPRLELPADAEGAETDA
jgi:methionyl-tRNA synthetase